MGRLHSRIMSDVEVYATVFTDYGFEVLLVEGEPDRSAHLIASRREVRMAVHCGLQDAPVDTETVRAASRARELLGADIVMVLSNQGFTPAAFAIAQQSDVVLLVESASRELFDLLD